ncbi:hypothetical protein ASE63_13350 [Bosea sp. Root381]|nr:hypothetical protein ASE63_13350 [Bosea sp. Root381]
MSRQSVTMRELQKLSAGAIQALPHPVPIKSGSATIGLLVPVRRPDVAALTEIEDEARRDYDSLSPEMRAKIDRYFAGGDA